MARTSPLPLRLRPGIEILRTGPDKFALLDAPTNRHFLLEAHERFLLHLLGRHDSLDAVVAEYQTRFGDGLGRRQVREFVEQLTRLDLLEDGPEPPPAPAPAPIPAAPTPPATARPAPPRPAPEAPPAQAPPPRRDPKAALNRRFDLLAVLFGWLLHPAWIAPTLALATIAVNLIARHWDRVVEDLRSPLDRFATEQLLALSMIQTFVFMNLPRAVVVGVACRRFGGRVRSFRPALTDWLTLTFECDTGDSFAWMSGRGRWTLLTADLWFQVALGSLTTIAWFLARPGSGMAVFFLYLVPPVVCSLAFNSIIFFKFYGYWILCYALDDPRLRERALAEVGAWLRFRTSPEALTRRERYWLRAYGLGYYGFRLAFDGALLAFGACYLTLRYQGFGAALFLALATYFYRDSLGRAIMGIPGLARLLRAGGVWWVRWPLRAGLVYGLYLVAMIPYRFEVVGECRTIPVEQYGVRAPLNDEVEAIRVVEGQHVEPGAVVATLVGRKARTDVLTTRSELDRARAQLELLQNGRREEDIKIASEMLEIARNRLELEKSQASRAQQLYRQKTLSYADLEKALTQYDDAQEKYLSARERLSKLTDGYREEQIRAAQAEVRRLEDLLRYNEELLDLAELKTPIRGRVVLPYMPERQGQATKPGDLLTVIQDVSRLRIEVAADEAAALEVRPGMAVNVRLYGNYGRLLTGRVATLAPTAEIASRFGNGAFRTDSEVYSEQIVNSRNRASGNHVRIVVDLDDYPPDLLPDMYGYARISVRDDVFWHALARPFVRFLRTEVWSWLP